MDATPLGRCLVDDSVSDAEILVREPDRLGTAHKAEGKGAGLGRGARPAAPAVYVSHERPTDGQPELSGSQEARPGRPRAVTGFAPYIKATGPLPPLRSSTAR